MYKLLIFLIFILLSNILLSKEQTADSSIVDSNYSIAPMREFGKISLLNTTAKFRSINKESLPYTNYVEFADLLEANLPIYPLNLGQYGANNGFYSFGAYPNNTAVNFNGRSITDRSFFNFNINQIAPEYFENAEIFIGSSAVINQDNASGMLINLQEIRYNTKYPYTKLWYAQAGSLYLASDGIYSQNIHPKLNFTFGFRSQSYDGNYANSQYDSWNVRTGVRFNPTEKTSISLTEIFTKYSINNNGGINMDTSEFMNDPITSITNFYSFQTNVFRNDLTLKMTSILADDSSSAINSSLYYSNSNWSNYRDSTMYNNVDDTLREAGYNEYYLGVNTSYEQKLLNTFSLRGGFDAMYFNTNSYKLSAGNQGSKLSLFAELSTAVSDNISAYTGLRFTSYESMQYTSFGGRLTYSDSTFKVFTDLSYSEALPNDFQLNLKNKEKHLLGLVDGKYKFDDFTILFNAYYRNTNNPIYYTAIKKDNTLIGSAVNQADKRMAFGGTLALMAELYENFNIKIWNMSQYSEMNSEDEEIMPAFYSGIDLSYTMHFNKSFVTFGSDIIIIGKNKSLQYVPVNRTYISSGSYSELSTNGINLYALAKLGRAFVKVNYNNTLSSQYYYTSYYPMQTANLRISIHWEFID